MKTFSRRQFSQIIASAGLTGTALVDTTYAEMQRSGTLPPDTVRSFLALTATHVPDDQLAPIQASLERALDSMRRIRDRTVAQERAPAVMFRVRR
jgi:hypothetical protein